MGEDTGIHASDLSFRQQHPWQVELNGRGAWGVRGPDNAPVKFQLWEPTTGTFAWYSQETIRSMVNVAINSAGGDVGAFRDTIVVYPLLSDAK